MGRGCFQGLKLRRRLQRFELLTGFMPKPAAGFREFLTCRLQLQSEPAGLVLRVLCLGFRVAAFGFCMLRLMGSARQSWKRQTGLQAPISLNALSS